MRVWLAGEKMMQVDETSLQTFYSFANVIGDPARGRFLHRARLPFASGANSGGVAHVTGGSGRAVLAFSESTDWRRVTDPRW